jgi:hypothetical protein
MGARENSDVAVGAVAAVSILFIVRPSDGIALVSASLIAGYAGRAIMAALEDKAKAVVAQQAALIAQQRANEATADVRRMLDAADKSKIPAGAGGIVRGGSAPVATPLDEIVAELRRKYKS